MWSDRVAFRSAILTASLALGCGGGPTTSDAADARVVLTPAQACEQLVENGEACGTYVPGSLGGTDRATDIAFCSAGFGGLDARCAELFSDAAQCGSAGCGAAVAHCQALLDELTTTCRP